MRTHWSYAQPLCPYVRMYPAKLGDSLIETNSTDLMILYRLLDVLYIGEFILRSPALKLTRKTSQNEGKNNDLHHKQKLVTEL